MISTLNGGMNNDRVYFFLDPESDNTIFFTYCFSSNFFKGKFCTSLNQHKRQYDMYGFVF